MYDLQAVEMRIQRLSSRTLYYGHGGPGAAFASKPPIRISIMRMLPHLGLLAASLVLGACASTSNETSGPLTSTRIATAQARTTAVANRREAPAARSAARAQPGTGAHTPEGPKAISSQPTFDEVAGESDRAFNRMEEMQKRWDRDAKRALSSVCPGC